MNGVDAETPLQNMRRAERTDSKTPLARADGHPVKE
jgi:hypothetical protein